MSQTLLTRIAGYLLISSLLVCDTCLVAQEATSPSPPIRVEKRAIVLDVNVRDSRGRFVVDLRPEEVTLEENGIRQRIDSLVYRGRSEGQTAASPTDHSGNLRNPATPPTFLCFLFTRVGPSGRLHAAQLRDALLKTGVPPNTVIGVFALQHSISKIGPLTTELKEAAAQIDKAAGLNYTGVGLSGANSLGLTELEGGADKPTNLINPPKNMLNLDRMISEVLRANFEKTRHDLAYEESTNALVKLRRFLEDLNNIPGQKTLILATEGMYNPTGNSEIMKSIGSAAALARVTIHTCDLRGLRPDLSINPEAADLQKVDVEDAITTVSPRTQDLTLGTIAESTGGREIVNTNGVQSGVSRILQDVGSRYELAYSPTNGTLDGSFRTIQVHVARRGLRVQTRAGYYALPAWSTGEAMLPFEFEALQKAHGREKSNSSPVQLRVYRFAAQGGRVQHVLSFAIPMHAVSLGKVQGTRDELMDLGYLAVVSSPGGEMVDKLSHEIIATMPKSKDKTGVVQYSGLLLLQPGVYSLVATVLDRQSNQGSTRKISLGVPNGEALLSSIVGVRNIVAYAREERFAPDNPLSTPQGKVVPETANQVSGSTKIFFVGYQDTVVTVAIAKDGQLLQSLQATPSSQNENVHFYFVSLPAAAGTYDVSVTAFQGSKRQEETAVFNVVN